MTKIVIAGSYHQYLQYLKDSGLTRAEAYYVSKPSQLWRVRDEEVVLYGTWWNNPCAFCDFLPIIEEDKGENDA